MKQVQFITTWGVLSESGGNTPLENLTTVLDKIQALGYTGVEIPIAHVMKYGSERFAAELTKRGMQFIAQVFSSGPPPIPDNIPGAISACGIVHPADNLLTDTHNVGRHCAIWAAQVREAMHIKHVLRSITSHTGRDYFTDAEAHEMLSFCEKLEAETGAPVYHETHRARMFYSPWVMGNYLGRHPAIRLVADLSHFTCVAEADTTDPELNRVVREVIVPRVHHVHARVGFEEGPQVPDPRGPSWVKYHEGFKLWWSAIYSAAAARGEASFSTTPEFGPRAYAWSHPYTDETLANVWEVNHFVGMECAALHGALFGSATAAPLLPEKPVAAMTG